MEGNKKIITISKSVLSAYAITFTLILCYSIILVYTNISESTIPICLFVIGMVSVFISSSMAVIKIKENGLKIGGIIGMCYVMILYLISSMYGSGFSLTKYSIMTIIFYVLFGMLGGIIGVNLANKK